MVITCIIMPLPCLTLKPRTCKNSKQVMLSFKFGPGVAIVEYLFLAIFLIFRNFDTNLYLITTVERGLIVDRLTLTS